MSPTFIAAAVALVLAFGAGWQVRAWKSGSDRASELQAAAADAMRRAEHVDTSAAGYETQRAAGQARARVITHTVERIIHDSPAVYGAGAPACIDDAGLQLIAQAIGSTDPTGEPAPALPPASAAR